jgi:hypothetical protein
MTNTKCHIDTVISPDDGHIVAQNMQRKEINILRKICTKLTLFTKLNYCPSLAGPDTHQVALGQ